MVGQEIRDFVFKLNTPLINDEEAIMKELVGWLAFESLIYQNQIKNFLLPPRQTATELIASLKNQYHVY
jgi:hypothetical protein